MNVHDTQFDAKTEAVIAKVRKLLALAKNNDNEHQAEEANRKAQELLEAYNLDIAHITKETGKFAARDKQKLRGGLYTWQRDLWHTTAQLNFCKYWYYKGLNKGSNYEHELLGSKTNVIATTVMAQYLQDTVERLARNWMQDNRPGLSIFTKEAIAYREGIVSRLNLRMWQIRRDRLAADEAKQKAERESNAARGVFTENALVLADVISSEEDLNNDYLYGYPAGTSAAKRKEAEARRLNAEAEANALMQQQALWDLAHPAEAAARKAKDKEAYDVMFDKWVREDKAKAQRTRRATPEEERRRMRSFSHGYDAGADISLDKQIDEDKRRLT